MAEHRTTQWAGRINDVQVRLMAIARSLMKPDLPPELRLEMGFKMGDEVLALGEISEAIRTGRRSRECEEQETAA